MAKSRKIKKPTEVDVEVIHNGYLVSTWQKDERKRIYFADIFDLTCYLEEELDVPAEEQDEDDDF